MKKLIFILMFGSLFADRIVFEQMGDTHTYDNVEFIKAGNGKVYFKAFGQETSRDCIKIVEFTSSNRYEPPCKSSPKLILLFRNQLFDSPWSIKVGIEKIKLKDTSDKTSDDFHRG